MHPTAATVDSASSTQQVPRLRNAKLCTCAQNASVIPVYVSSGGQPQSGAFGSEVCVFWGGECDRKGKLEVEAV
jgi:hypothetical protein